VAARRSGLGRGLGALIPDDAQAQAEIGASFQELPLDSIVPNPFQPREEFDEAGIASLADSIEQIGVLQPILVRPDGEGSFQIIAGERRWRASRQAGLDVIPAIVREVRDVGALEQAVVENLHRQDLNALEEAAAFQQLIDDFGFTQEQLAQRVGKSRPSVTNTLRLLNLPPAIQGLLIDGRLAAAHARALLPVEDRAGQQRLAEQCVAEGWSVRQVEAAVKAGAPAPKKDADKSTEPGTTRPAALMELEELLSDHLDTRVAVQMGAKRGKIVVDFADLDDLERLYRVIIAGD
jgi:ParB family transcriptional regulator, chromosome partitioning protein